MRRVLCEVWGPPESLMIVEEPDPLPGAGQVVVEIAAAGVNFVDALFVAGTYQIKVPPPFTPGSEFAGTVSAVGERVTEIKVGDQVLSSLGLGAWASHVVVAASSLTPVPTGLDLPVAAALVQRLLHRVVRAHTSNLRWPRGDGARPRCRRRRGARDHRCGPITRRRGHRCGIDR